MCVKNSMRFETISLRNIAITTAIKNANESNWLLIVAIPRYHWNRDST